MLSAFRYFTSTDLDGYVDTYQHWPILMSSTGKGVARIGLPNCLQNHTCIKFKSGDILRGREHSLLCSFVAF